jgi:hypothetical protein
MLTFLVNIDVYVCVCVWEGGITGPAKTSKFTFLLLLLVRPSRQEEIIT